jgi:hypothetical protein
MVDLTQESFLAFSWGLELRWQNGFKGLCTGGHSAPPPGNNRSRVNKVVPKKEKNSNVISMVSLTCKSVLTFSRGLELCRQTGLKVRVLVLSKLSAEENIFLYFRRVISANFSILYVQANFI